MKSSVSFSSRLENNGTNIFSVMSSLAAEHNAINLGQGFPDFDADPVLLELVAKSLHEGHNQYGPLAGMPILLEAISKKIYAHYETKIDPSTEICVTSGATQALFTAITSIISKGDEVIIIEPAYDCYKPQIAIAGGIPVPYRLRYPDYRIDWDEFRELVSSKTKMIIINTPHNPTGTILSSDDMKALESLVEGKNIVVLSDEVYEHIVFDKELHHSVLRFPNLMQQSMAVFSFGKTLHATGWKLGYIVGPAKLIESFKSIHQWNVFCSNTFLQVAIAEYLNTTKNIDGLGSFFQAKRDHMLKHFNGLPLEAIKSKGTYFQLYSYAEINEMNDIDFAKYLTTQIGVAAIPLSPFYSVPSKDKVIRFCFAKRIKTMENAARRLKKLND